MATIIRGKKKGKTVEISQWANDWISTTDNQIFSPLSLQYTEEEFKILLESQTNNRIGMFWKFYYPDEENLRIKRRQY